MRIYVAAPYSSATDAEQEQKAKRSVRVGVDLMRNGHMPFMPLLMHWFDIEAKEKGIEFSYQEYIDWALTWLQQCDGVLCCLGRSKGVDTELARARELGMPVYWSIDEIPRM
jgi:hypothetical protein